MKYIQIAFILMMILMCKANAQPASDLAPMSEYECLHLNIGLLALLETENDHYQRHKQRVYESNSAVAKGLTLLKERGESCSIKTRLYVEAAKFSLHHSKFDEAVYFSQRAKARAVE